MALDGALTDLNDPIERDARIEFLTREDPRSLELIRHDCAHVLAEAVQTLWPGTQVTIGPVIENGFYYDFFRNQPFTPEDFAAIEKTMREIIGRDKPFTKEVWSRDEAKRVFKDKGELFKVELVDAIPKDQQIKIYKQGDWFDLCRGPHMTSTGKIGSAFKLMKVAGAYWRGDSNREMLSRIYGTAFAKQEELDAYLRQLEEAEKRDHRKLGREMDLFHFQEEAPGSVFWHPKGWTLFQTLENYIRRRQAEAGYVEVNSPQLMDSQLWVTSGHMEKYREMMFLTEHRNDDERIYAIKPMNCPGHVQIFKNGLKSYRDLPLKLAEFGKVHRFEPSGALHGLMRVRAFTQDDAHIFITESQIAEEVLKMNEMILSIYEDFGFPDVSIRFSDRPAQRIGDDAVWDKAEAALMAALKASGRPWTLDKGEGAFYGPKLDYALRDAIGRDWQCGTVQVDLNLPGRLGAFYIDEHSNKVTPVMLHRAMFGSLERFTGMLIEHFAGHLPLWLNPLQAVVATITDDANDYARQVVAAARRAGLRVEEDLRNEKINYKVREHSLAKVPVLLVVGKKEAAEHTVSIRRLGKDGQQVIALDKALAMLTDEAVPPDVRRLRQAA
jgi:threonyl-tRNA synthetase